MWDAILFCETVGPLLSGFPLGGLGRCLMVDAPAVFASTWSAVRGILNEVTAGKKLGETMTKVMVGIWQLYVYEQSQKIIDISTGILTYSSHIYVIHFLYPL